MPDTHGWRKGEIFRAYGLVEAVLDGCAIASIAKPKPSRDAPVPAPNMKATLAVVGAAAEAPLAPAELPKLIAETVPG
jgi:hypothetical protein